jgi:hypothetical protein
MISEDDFWSSWWNENWQGKPKYSEKTFSLCMLYWLCICVCRLITAIYMISIYSLLLRCYFIKQNWVGRVIQMELNSYIRSHLGTILEVPCTLTSSDCTSDLLYSPCWIYIEFRCSEYSFCTHNMKLLASYRDMHCTMFGVLRTFTSRVYVTCHFWTSICNVLG